MTVKLIAPNEITAERLQSRAIVSQSYIDEIAERMVAGDKFPPIPVIQNDEQSWLPDGLHRLEGATKAGVEIAVDFIKGTQDDAIKMACSANIRHGLRQTNSDKRRAVALAIKRLGDISDEAISDLCGVSRRFVVDQRRFIKEEEKARPVNGSQVAKKQPETRVGLDGKRRRMPKKSASSHKQTAKKSGEQKADVRVWDKFDDLFGKITRLVDDINREFPHSNNHRQVVAHFNSAYAIASNWKTSLR